MATGAMRRPRPGSPTTGRNRPPAGRASRRSQILAPRVTPARAHDPAPQLSPMTTVHFVYPRDASRNSSPFCIGNEVGDRLARDYDVRFYGWRDQVLITPKPGDILLGHPHWRRDSVFDRSVRQPGFARRILMAPYADDLRQVAYYDRHMDQCDLFLAITGNYWFDPSRTRRSGAGSPRCGTWTSRSTARSSPS